ncbi:MAG TPA: glycoside hydrolase family 97 protein [Chitinophagaceae bacterium]|nr:glycoside hydrolase family 97 protein [Chitinophagaceae bacterium]
MKLKTTALLAVFLCAITASFSQKYQSTKLTSPDGNIVINVHAGEALQWSVTQKGQPIIMPSAISLITDYGDTIGANAKVISAKVEAVDEAIPALHYKRDTVIDNYNQLTLTCKGDFGVIFRAYNDGVAYRFFTKMNTSLIIGDEQANFNFADDDSAYIPYSNDPHEGDKYQTSFENLYQHIKLSQFVKDSVAFAPVLVELPHGKKAVITEADLEDYPGMFLQGGPGNNLHGNFAPFVLETKPNSRNDAQVLVRRRAGYIAKTMGTRSFPWRVVVISENDKELLNSDMVYKLASPSRVDDVSWIKPGKVAWDWWNDWNISHVNFRAGINTDTYKYYIDFAAANHIEYILMDAGWSDGKNLMKIIPGIDLPQIIAYGKQKNVGVWLWAGSEPMDNDMDEVLDYYSKLGIKGFKVDFMDRDDQAMVNFYYTLAQKAADHHLMIDYHGAYKPTGLQRTYPNVMNFEGVRGLENAKWSAADMPPYDATIPFIRMLAGPMDYTPGAMKNANKQNFRPIYAAPMSQGTRCHQLAMYVVYEAPFEMLSDNPNNYMKEQECTNFIASVPTIFNQTVALNSKVGEYAAIARRSGTTWFVGAIGDWNAHDITVDLSFLGSGTYEAEIFKDGINADREATDYVKQVIKVSAGDKLPVHLSAGGGWVARIYPEN